MDILEKVRASEKIKDFFYRFCDFELYETFTDKEMKKCLLKE